MIDELVAFEVAKLAKQKGFNISTKEQYCIKPISIQADNGRWADFKVGEVLDSYSSSCVTQYEETDVVPAPTQSLLHRWLRETKNIDIVIAPERYKTGINYVVQAQKFDLENGELGRNFIVDGTFWFNDNHEFPTYEDALDKGLYEGLKLI